MLTARSIGQSEFSQLSPTQTQMIRVFDAPRQLVWDAYTRAEHIANWWSKQPFTTTVEKQDCRKGGAWRYVRRNTEGKEWAFRGEFLDVAAPEKLVLTFEFEGTPGEVVTEALTLEDLGDKTRIVAVSTYDTAEALQGMAAIGMAEGANEAYDRLAALLAKLQQVR